MELGSSLTDDASFAHTRTTSDTTGTWPYEPTIVTHVLGGALAERVRRRLNADAHDEVRLTETTFFGGYSAWTQENNTEFTVECDGQKVTFTPHGGTADWRQDAGKPYADSVYARFDAWLSVAERPAALFAEWFEHDEEYRNVVRYRARPDTILIRAARERKILLDHVSLTGVGDGLGRQWELCLVAVPDRTGLQKVLERLPLTWEEGLTVSDTVARAVLTKIADDLFRGRERQ